MKKSQNPIKDPRITEKASDLSARNVYVFNIDASSNKEEVKKAIFQLYKVRPERVNIVNTPRKKVASRRGRGGMRGGGKKAMVYLKEGDKIELV